MTINWDADILHIDLVPVGRPLGRKTQSVTVFKEYGDVKSRFVQAFASKLGGELVYVEAKKGSSIQTIPVTVWRNSSDGGTYVMGAADFVAKMAANGYEITCFGSSRHRWTMNVRSENSVHDAVDNATDRGSSSGGTCVADVVEANGIRANF